MKRSLSSSCDPFHVSTSRRPPALRTPRRRRRDQRARPTGDGSPERGDEDGVEPGGGRREELDDGAVIEREPGGAEPLGIGREIEPPARVPRLEIGETIAAIAPARQEHAEIGEKEHGGAGGTTQRLLEGEKGRLASEIARAQP